jgi:tetratricopeptide (TPR) repeat protein
MNEDHFANCLEKGIHLAQEGDPAQAQIFLSQAVQDNPKSAKAWYWLSLVISDPEKKMYCFSKAFALEPDIAEKSQALNHNPSQVYQPETDSKNPPLVTEASLKSTPVESTSFETKLSTPAKAEETLEEMPAQGNDKPHPNRAHSTPLRILFGILITLIACGIPIAYLTLSGNLDGLIPITGAGKTNTQNILVFSTEPTLQSFPPTKTFAIIPSSTPLPTTTTTPFITIQVLVQSIAMQMSDAVNRIAAKDYANAILILDRVISVDPKNVEAYYQRGMAYFSMTHSIRSQGEFLNYLEKSLADLDQAIEIGPLKANYFVQRANVLHAIADEMEYTVDSDPLYAASLQNMHLGMAYGTTIYGVPEDAARLHNMNGECSTGLSELKELEKAVPSKSAEYYEVERAMAETYECLGQYAKALEKINEALKCGCDYWQYNILNAEILYYNGDKDQALEILDKDIEETPAFAGSRYYLRALIYYDQGKYDLARADLDTGAGNTWFHKGIFPYLLAKFAVMDRDMESAKSWLQYAEASLARNENPSLVRWIKQDMAYWGFAPLSPTRQFFINITPMPAIFYESIPPTATPTLRITPQANNPAPGGNTLPTGYLDAIPVDFAVGIGPRAIDPGMNILFHFVPRDPVTVIRATKIIFHLLPVGGFKPPLQVYMWTREGGWRMIDPLFGDNEIQYPSFYIGEKGDFYISLRNYSPSQPVNFENAGFTVTVERADGSTFTYGLNP